MLSGKSSISGTQGPDMTLNLVQVFVNFVHQHGQIYAGMGTKVPDNGTNQFQVKFDRIFI